MCDRVELERIIAVKLHTDGGSAFEQRARDLAWPVGAHPDPQWPVVHERTQLVEVTGSGKPAL